ncbi:MAG: hypothetical protein FWC58_04910 [Desulfobulbus sp.]|nr:hypothetical protein [Desulfobulbus sp.]
MTAITAAAFFLPAGAAEPAAGRYEALARLSPAELAAQRGQVVEVDVDLAASPGFSVDIEGERATLRYRMAFNQVTEGWNWQPQADPANEDYYRDKFLPLQSVVVERGEYEQEDKIGSPQRMTILWRYDYFLAFANLYDFYPRRADDDAGFSADLPAELAAHVGLRARARLLEPVISESTTFWKATHAQPTDFTLKKRYLIGALDAIDVVDQRDGRVICRILPGSDHCQGN